jgi:hypothetical protein
MANRPVLRPTADILKELFEGVQEKLDEILNIHKQLGDKTLSQGRALELYSKMCELWIDLEPMHDSIREQNPKGDMFFNSLDKEIELYKKGPVDLVKVPETKENE